MGRLDGRLDLIAAKLAHPARPEQQRLGLFDESRIPLRGILFGERYIIPVGRAARAPARFGMEHQGQQTQRLGRVGKERNHQTSKPSGRSSWPGTRNGMPASRILFLARESRWPMAAGETRNAEAIVAASKPSRVCKISGARIPGSIAGCAQANISESRSSGISTL